MRLFLILIWIKLHQAIKTKIMKYRLILTVTAICICFASIAQSERKLNKNFSFVITGKLDTISSFSIGYSVKRSGWGEFYGSLTQALIAKGFKVNSQGYAASSHSFKINIDYSRGFFAGSMQYENLRGQIIDTKNSDVVGTFMYDGRFETDDISNAIASALKNRNPIIVKEEEIKQDIKQPPVSQNTQTGKSKEERLRELKDLFEKQLITKEEYDRAKQKIIEEQ